MRQRRIALPKHEEPLHQREHLVYINVLSTMDIAHTEKAAEHAHPNPRV